MAGIGYIVSIVGIEDMVGHMVGYMVEVMAEDTSAGDKGMGHNAQVITPFKLISHHHHMPTHVYGCMP